MTTINLRDSCEFRDIPDTPKLKTPLTDSIIKEYGEEVDSRLSIARWKNVLPFEHNRVKSSTGFVEASHITVSVDKPTVVVGSAPIPSNFRAWWDVIWSQGVQTIYCLTKTIEKGICKMDPYWPSFKKLVSYSEFTITHINTTLLSPSLEMIELEICNNVTQQTRRVKLFFYSGWPDFDVPSTCTECCYILKNMYATINGGGKILIHCSAGKGRTGVMCAALRVLFTGESVSTAIANIRQERQGMVQTPRQYRFTKQLLIAYNMGMGNLEGRQQLTRTMGKI